MKVKTATITGPALDWAVAKCVGATEGYKQGEVFLWGGRPVVTTCGHDIDFTPSNNWAQGGPIFYREGITVGPYYGEDCKPTGVFQARIGWDDNTLEPLYQEDGPTPLVAAMRCYVATKLGDEIEIPEELSTT